jgi:hypothetical protein
VLRAVIVSAILVAAPTTVAAQVATLHEQPLLGSTLTPDFARDLPTTNNPFLLLETIPEVISDRFSSGGLNAAAARVSARS